MGHQPEKPHMCMVATGEVLWEGGWRGGRGGGGGGREGGGGEGGGGGAIVTSGCDPG